MIRGANDFQNKVKNPLHLKLVYPVLCRQVSCHMGEALKNGGGLVLHPSTPTPCPKCSRVEMLEALGDISPPIHPLRFMIILLIGTSYNVCNIFPFRHNHEICLISNH